MGTPEIVVNRARPFSSRFTPVAAPIGFSAAFSSDGYRVFSAHCFSESEGRRFSVISEIGFSETCDKRLSGMAANYDDRRQAEGGASAKNDNSVGGGSMIRRFDHEGTTIREEFCSLGN